MPSAVVDKASPSFDLRREARRRTWVCPGSGYYLLGRKAAAAAAYASGLASIASAIATAWNPTQPRLWGTIALVVISTALWVSELFSAYASWPLTSTDKPSKVGYRSATLAMWTVFFLFAAVVLLSYRITSFAGEAMSPLLHDGDRLLVQNHVDPESLQRGALVMFRLNEENKFTQAGSYMIGRILALPGDVLSLRAGNLYVNDKLERAAGSTEPYPIALQIARHPEQTHVPLGAFFIVQDSPDEGLDSRVFWWALYHELVSTRMFALGGAPPVKRLE